MPPAQNVKVGVAAWIRKGHDVLMIFRENTAPEHEIQLDGHQTWSVPGGWVDDGETHLQAAQREVKEEVGLDVIAERVIDVTTGPNDAGSLTIVCIWVECSMVFPDQEPRNMEPTKVSAVEWMPLVGMRDLPLFHNLSRFLDQTNLVDRQGKVAHMEDPSNCVQCGHPIYLNDHGVWVHGAPREQPLWHGLRCPRRLTAATPRWASLWHCVVAGELRAAALCDGSSTEHQSCHWTSMGMGSAVAEGEG